jgi:hypothetical protein
MVAELCSATQQFTPYVSCFRVLTTARIGFPSPSQKDRRDHHPLPARFLLGPLISYVLGTSECSVDAAESPSDGLMPQSHLAPFIVLHIT